MVAEGRKYIFFGEEEEYETNVFEKIYHWSFAIESI